LDEALDALRWGCLAVPFILLLPVAQGILHSHRSFALPAAFPSVLHGTLLVAMILGSADRGISAALWGTVAGFVLAAALLLAAAFARLRGPAAGSVRGELREMRNLSMLLLVLQALPLAQLVITRYLASATPGGISAFTYAERILSPPAELVGGVIGSVLLPTLVSLRGHDREGEADQKAVSGIATSFLLLCACAVAIMTAAPEIVALLLQHGEFGAEDARLTASVIGVYALVLPTAANHVVFRTLLSRNRAGAVVVLSLLLIPLFASAALLLRNRFELVGVAAAVSLTNFLLFLGCLGLLAREIGAERRKPLLLSLGKILLAAAVSYFLVHIALAGAKGANAWVRLATAAGLVALTYSALLLFLRVPEFPRLLGRSLRRPA